MCLAALVSVCVCMYVDLLRKTFAFKFRSESRERLHLPLLIAFACMHVFHSFDKDVLVSMGVCGIGVSV